MAEYSLAWRPSRALSTRAMLSLWLACLVALPGALLLQRLTVADPGLGPVRVACMVTFLWLVVAWVWPERPLRRRLLALTVVLELLVFVAVGVALLERGVLLALRMGVAAVVQAVVVLAFYRWRLGDDNLTPHRPRDLGDLAIASVLGAAAVIPIGPAPGIWVTSGPLEVLWWSVLGAAYIFVGGACLLLLAQRRPRAEAIPTRLRDVYVLLVLTGACLVVALTDRGVPLTWIVMLPAVWAGLTLGPWTSAAYCLTTTVSVAAAQSLPGAARTFDSTDAVDVLLLNGLMTAFVFVVLVLSLVRDQRAHLADEVVRRRQEALDQAGLLGTVFESINEGLLLLDTQGRVQLTNAAATRILGEQNLDAEPRQWLLRLREQPTFTYPFHRDDTEDGVRVLSVQLAPVQYAGSDSVVAIVRDVTTEQRRIEELASFAAVAAHDLKGPLAAVQGWMEVAEDALTGDPDMTLRALERGRHATDRMSREIDDWLTYNVAREGVVAPEPVPLQETVEAIVATFPGVDVDVRAPDTVLVDRTLLQHLLVNLLGNAVKYAVPGERPCVTVRSLEEAPGWVRLEVTDTGIGIPEGEESSIFEPFRRASTVQDEYEGSGLGLALCKRIVRRHGGRISAHRNDGPGTTIRVSLPAG